MQATPSAKTSITDQHPRSRGHRPRHVPFLFGLRDDAQIGLRRLPALGVLIPGVLIRDGGDDDDVLALLLANERRHLFFGVYPPGSLWRRVRLRSG